MGDAVDALDQCDKDLTLSAADRAELSAASGRIQTNSAKLKDAADSLNTAVNDLKGYLDGSKHMGYRRSAPSPLRRPCRAL